MTTTTMAQTVIVTREEVLNRRARVEKMQEIKDLASDVSYLSQTLIDDLSDENLDALKKALQRSKKISKGKITVEPTPVETYLSCEVETTETMNFTKKAQVNSKINQAAKDFFQLNSYLATQFSTQWMEKYPCDIADAYIANAGSLFKVSNTYMELNSYLAAQYAKANVEKICDAEQLSSTAKQLNSYAKNQLGMNSYLAGKYTKDWVDSKLMGCSLPQIGDLKQ